MSTNKTDVVGEYLREVDLRLSGLPLLQRRELLADLETHIETARLERNIQSEGEMIEVLERLGSPEVVAAAAYQEGGPVQTPARPATTRSGWLRWIIAAAVVFFLLFLLGVLSLFFARVDSASPVEAPQLPAVVVPADPMPTG